jgi:hypothetical protein
MTQLHDLRLRLLVQQESARFADSQIDELVQARSLCWLALLGEAHEEEASDAERRGDVEQATGWFADSMRLPTTGEDSELAKEEGNCGTAERAAVAFSGRPDGIVAEENTAETPPEKGPQQRGYCLPFQPGMSLAYRQACLPGAVSWLEMAVPTYLAVAERWTTMPPPLSAPIPFAGP